MQQDRKNLRLFQKNLVRVALFQKLKADLSVEFDDDRGSFIRARALPLCSSLRAWRS
jgi:hypothetical protein